MDKKQKLEIGDVVRATCEITESGIKPGKANAPRGDFTHAYQGDLGHVVHIDESGKPSVRFRGRGTVTVVGHDEYEVERSRHLGSYEVWMGENTGSVPIDTLQTDQLHQIIMNLTDYLDRLSQAHRLSNDAFNYAVKDIPGLPHNGWKPNGP